MHRSEESEKVSELKSVSGSSKLPYGTLASATEGIREAISSFDDACVFIFSLRITVCSPLASSCSRKSDIENERLPPELFDADSVEGKALLSNSLPTTPSEPDTGPTSSVVPSNGVSEGLERAMMARGAPLSRINTTSSTTASPVSPVGTSPGGFKRGHSRQASLGTTMTSPSTRRRSLESTMSLIQGVLEGNRLEEQDDVDNLTNRLAGSSVQSQGTSGGGPARGY